MVEPSPPVTRSQRFTAGTVRRSGVRSWFGPLLFKGTWSRTWVPAVQRWEKITRLGQAQCFVAKQWEGTCLDDLTWPSAAVFFFFFFLLLFFLGVF